MSGEFKDMPLDLLMSCSRLHQTLVGILSRDMWMWFWITSTPILCGLILTFTPLSGLWIVASDLIAIYPAIMTRRLYVAVADGTAKLREMSAEIRLRNEVISKAAKFVL